MLKRLGLPILALVASAGCGILSTADPADTTVGPTVAPPAPTTAAATPTTASATPTTAAPTPTTAAPTTAAPTTAAPTTAAPTPTTAAPTPTTEAGGGNAAAPTGDLDVITVSGMGAANPPEGVVAELDKVGFGADSQAIFTNFGGTGIFPFVNIDGGRMVDLRISTDEYVRWRYTYLIGNPDGQTPEQLAQAAAAPIKERFPENSEATETRQDDTRSYFGIDLEGPEYTDPSWTITASNDSDEPTYSVIIIELDATVENPTTGAALVPPVYKAVVDAALGDAQLSADNIDGFTSDAGIGFGSAVSSLTLDAEMPGLTFAEAIDSLRPLTEKGYELDEGTSVVFKSEKVDFQVHDADEYESSETGLTIRIEVL